MSDQPFPRRSAAFLNLCAGEWMSLRSSFELSSGGDDDWHSSEQGVAVGFTATPDAGPGQLRVSAPAMLRRFWPLRNDGGLTIDGSAAGRWRFWPTAAWS